MICVCLQSYNEAQIILNITHHKLTFLVFTYKIFEYASMCIYIIYLPYFGHKNNNQQLI